MSAGEETIDATLDSNGQLRLSHQPRLPPGPVRVTIRTVAAPGARRGLADVVREIAAEQRARGFPAGRQQSCEPKRMRAWTRMPSGTAN